MSRDDSRRWQCSECSNTFLWKEILLAPNPFAPNDDAVQGCPMCKACNPRLDLLCDEPGCNKSGGCGWPTGDKGDQWGGYRFTCFEHTKRLAP